MGRLARPPTAHAEQLRGSLRAYLETSKLSLNAFAKSQNVKQSTLYRFWNGETKEPSGVLMPALNYAHNELSAMPVTTSPPKVPPLRQLAMKVSGNRNQEALILEQLVLALAPVVRAILAGHKESKGG